MSDRYPGGLIRKTPPTITPPVDGEGGSAPGIWTLEQVAYYEKEGLWPKPILPVNLYAWGSNAVGNLGQNNIIDSSSPVQVSEPSWSKTSSNGYNKATAAIKTDGTLWTWGDNSQGQLGHGDVIYRSSPVQVGALSTWAEVSTGLHTVAVKTDGTLWAWGRNGTGQLGQNNRIYRSSPVQIGSGTDWYKVESGNDESSLALKTDGTMWSWGYNLRGQLGQNNAIYRSSPVQIGSLTTWSQIAIKNDFAGAVKTDGTLWTWGQGSLGQLGHGNTIARSSPVQLGALTSWLKVSCGQQHSLFLKNDNTVWGTGENGKGCLTSDVPGYTTSPLQIGTLSNWANISAGHAQTFLISTTDAYLWAIGNNSAGGLGLGDTVHRSSPVQVGLEGNWQTVNCAIGNTGAPAVVAIQKG
jgi:alpha-tubulin suppressor-like RCC1 family protein